MQIKNKTFKFAKRMMMNAIEMRGIKGVINVSHSDSFRLDALNYIYRLEREGKFEIEYWQLKKIVCKLLTYNVGRGIYYSPSRKFRIFNLHER